MRHLGRSGLIVLFAASAGCATIYSRTEPSVVDSPVYEGVRMDAEFIGLAAVAPFRDDDGAIAFLLLPFALIDLPLSLVADTVLLPLTIPEHFSSRRKAAKALVAAIEEGDLARAQAVVETDPGLLRIDVGQGDSPLDLATRKGHREIVDWLASEAAGADQVEDLDGALIIAVEAGRADLVRVLLDRGSNPDGRPEYVRPMRMAVMLEDPAVAELLLDRGASVTTPPGTDTPLHWAAFHGSAAVAELLIARGLDVNARGDGGSTPLHVAAWRGHADVVRVLVDRGGDVNSLDEDHRTPLAEALSWKRAEVAELLRSLGGVE